MKLLEFGALWCPECAIMRPRLEKIRQELPWLEFEFIDIDQKAEMKKSYRVDHLPSFIFLDKEHQEIIRLKGLFEIEELIKKINEYKNK